MKNKKGSVHIGAIIVVIIILLATAAGVGYFLYQKNIEEVANFTQNTEEQVNNTIENPNESEGEIVVNNTFNEDIDINSEFTEDDVMQNNEQKKINMVLILDSSGSMAEDIEGSTRMDIAKNNMINYVTNLDKNIYLSVVVYGHKGDNSQLGKEVSCKGVEEIYYMGEINKDVVVSKINNLKPNGWTPISDSLKKASDILMKDSGPGVEKHIVLLSDGEETCGGNPVAVAKQLKDEGISIDVIGLNVSGAVKSQLNNISVSGGGVYYGVENVDDFNAVVNDMGVKLNTGNLKMNVGNDGVSIEGNNGFLLETNDDGATVKMDGVDMKATNDDVSVDVPGVSIPSF